MLQALSTWDRGNAVVAIFTRRAQRAIPMVTDEPSAPRDELFLNRTVEGETRWLPVPEGRDSR
jgi:hypothetical protein